MSYFDDSKSMITISRVTKIDDNKWIGYEIWGYSNESKDRKQTKLMRFVIENASFCCETFGTYITGSTGKHNNIEPPKDPSKNNDRTTKRLAKRLSGQIIESIKWGIETKSGETNTNQVLIKLTNGHVVTFWAYNIHNGYYSHELVLSRFGKTETAEL